MRRVLFGMCFVLLCGVLAVADAPQTGVVSGTVTDPDGNPMPGATVQLKGERGVQTSVTGDDGIVRFVFLHPGEYTVQVDLPGFQPMAGKITVSAGGRADMVLQLSLVMDDVIMVTAETPLVNKHDMTTGGTLDPQGLEMVTGQGQQYRSRLLWMPGTFNDEQSDDAGGNRPSISGLSGSRQMYFVDGVDVSFARWGGGSQLNLPAGSVQETKLETTGTDAELSRTIGAFARTVVKSGTNQWHGSFWYQMSNLDWYGENENIDVPRPDEIEDGFDATFGGPIVRDKLWFYLGHRDVTTPGIAIMADGESQVSPKNTGGSTLVKLTWQPSNRHSVSGMWVDTPFDFPYFNAVSYAETPTVAAFDWGGDITTLHWNFAISDNLLLSTHLGITAAKQDRSIWEESSFDPDCDPSQPCGNSRVYRDRSSRLFWNGFTLPLGIGQTEFPREQANASLNWFAGSHDLKFGVDYQQFAWDASGINPPYCQGYGYNPTGPGGYNGNASGVARYLGYCRFYPTRDSWQEGWETHNEGTNTGIFIRDRMSFKRWTVNLGVRADLQDQSNDLGIQVMDNTSVVPRLGATWDALGDSSLILSGSAGRYVANLSLSWGTQFNQQLQGRIGGGNFEQYHYNTQTGSYDILSRVVGPLPPDEYVNVEPYYKDEITLGGEWQFNRNWAVKIYGTYWKAQNYPVGTDQFDENGEFFRSIGNPPELENERRAVDISVQRRFAKNWMLVASYTWSKTEGNCQYSDNGACDSAANPPGEWALWTNPDGTPWSLVNRWGSLNEDRPHIFKVRAAYDLKLGKGHAINLGGFFYVNSGKPWNNWINLSHPELGSSVATTVFTEPRGAQRIDSRMQLDFNAQWSFPIGGEFSGFARAELINATNEQVQVGTAGMAVIGEPYPATANFQYPRMVRIQVGLNF